MVNKKNSAPTPLISWIGAVVLVIGVILAMIGQSFAAMIAGIIVVIFAIIGTFQKRKLKSKKR